MGEEWRKGRWRRGGVNGKGDGDGDYLKNSCNKVEITGRLKMIEEKQSSG